jgi:hypothetical protein
MRPSHRAAVAVGGGIGIVVAQALLARSRRYLFDAAPGEIDEQFGDGDKRVHLVVLGDSTSVGVGAGSRAASYPALLARLLGRHVSVRLDVLGRSGVRMADVAAELAPRAASMRPDIVLIGVGVNDAIHLTPLPKFRDALREALEILADAGTTTVVALGPRLDALRCHVLSVVWSRRAAGRSIGASGVPQRRPVLPSWTWELRLAMSSPAIRLATSARTSSTPVLRAMPCGLERSKNPSCASRSTFSISSAND